LQGLPWTGRGPHEGHALPTGRIRWSVTESVTRKRLENIRQRCCRNDSEVPLSADPKPKVLL
jgi:hypothetical protein